MFIEIESKFQVTSPDVFDQIRSQKKVLGYPMTNRKITLQQDTYLDTTSGTLFHNKNSLRIREKQGAYFVTFKGQIKGNQVRTELEIEITELQAREVLNGHIANVRVKAIQTALTYAEKQFLLPVLHVENTREAWYVNSEFGRIKICFDDVRYTIPEQGQCQYISEYELELELQAGDEKFLHEIAHALSQQYELRPNSQSKYERGIVLWNVFETTL